MELNSRTVDRSQIFSAGYIGSLARRLPAWVEQQNGGSTFVYMSNDWKSSYSAAQLQFNRLDFALAHACLLHVGSLDR